MAITIIQMNVLRKKNLSEKNVTEKNKSYSSFRRKCKKPGAKGKQFIRNDPLTWIYCSVDLNSKQVRWSMSIWCYLHSQNSNEEKFLKPKEQYSGIKAKPKAWTNLYTWYNPFCNRDSISSKRISHNSYWILQINANMETLWTTGMSR